VDFDVFVSLDSIDAEYWPLRKPSLKPRGRKARTTPLRLFFFRHGETLWSLSGRHTGRTDIPLTANGEEQARMLRSWVVAASFSRVLTSPRLRARATCELSGANSNPDVEPDLAEWDYGDYEGLRSADICYGRPGWNLFRDGCPNGESPAQVCRRADRLIAHLRTMEGDVALFSHGQFGAVLAARWIGLEVVEGQHFSIGPATLSLLSYDIDHATVPVIGLWNAVPGCDARISSR
jgi:probable phosphoglycerate mutase